jgi:hypothetical protein
MNPVPFVFKLWGRWDSIQNKVDDWAAARGYPPYRQSPEQYQFSGWGTVGFPPRIACNVKYLPPPGAPIVDAGRFVA